VFADEALIADAMSQIAKREGGWPGGLGQPRVLVLVVVVVVVVTGDTGTSNANANGVGGMRDGHGHVPGVHIQIQIQTALQTALLHGWSVESCARGAWRCAVHRTSADIYATRPARRTPHGRRSARSAESAVGRGAEEMEERLFISHAPR
jgi:hypothetical protein